MVESYARGRRAALRPQRAPRARIELGGAALAVHQVRVRARAALLPRAREQLRRSRRTLGLGSRDRSPTVGCYSERRRRWATSRWPTARPRGATAGPAARPRPTSSSCIATRSNRARSPRTFAAELVAELADDQREAVLHHAGAARVIAPAGSGKTRVLTERLRRLIACGWNPGSLTAVAYNVRAKDTMRERLVRPSRRRPRSHPNAALARQRHRAARATVGLPWSTSGRSAGASRRWCRYGRRRTPTCSRRTSRRSARFGSGSSIRTSWSRAATMSTDSAPCSTSTATSCTPTDRSTTTSRSTARSKCCCDHPTFGVAVQRECRHLLADEFQDLTPAQLLADPARGRARVRRVRGRRRRPGHLRIRGRRSRVPHQLRRVPPRRHAITRWPPTTAARKPSSARPATSSRTTGAGSTRRSSRPSPPTPMPATQTLTVATAAPERTPLAAIEQATKWLSDGARALRHRGVEPGQCLAPARATAVRRGPRAVLDPGQRRGAQPNRYPHRALVHPARGRGEHRAAR